MIIYRRNFDECVNYLSEVVPTIKQLQFEITMNKGRGTGNINMSVESNKRRPKKNSKIEYTNKKEKKCPSENRHNNKSRNSRIRKFGEASYAQANIDREESKKLNEVFEKNVLIDRNEEIYESNSAMTNLKRQTPRH
ncbi:hypothetical protein H8356DRAFT_1083613 [Neocallimastix lanati (nom. inval.)]|nr:hypothetical protein H8356DRAFT_1083613 [Neocallimastix sp. JGI-2020a]